LIQNVNVSQKPWKTGKNNAKCHLHREKLRPRFSIRTRKNGVILHSTKVSGDCLQTNESIVPIILRHKVRMGKETRVSKDSNGKSIRKQDKTIRLIQKQTYNYSARLLTISNDIESNPGPNPSNTHTSSKTNLLTPLEFLNKNNHFLATYNLNGCKNYKKLKRITNLFNSAKWPKNSVINLQETHLSEEKTLNYHWKHGCVQSTTSNNSGGVAILFNRTQYDKILEIKNDKIGRICSFTAAKNDETYSYINIYAPNNHYESIVFFDKVDEWIESTLLKYPNCNIILSGDFNVVMDPKKDSVGRSTKTQEVKVADKIRRIMTRHDLIDSYRQHNKWGGFTWGRNNPEYVRSRLDYILISNSLAINSVQSYTNKYPNESDHSILYTELSYNELKFGPGILKCNSSLLENKQTKERIEANINKIVEDMPAHWNHHCRLDYAKMKLRELMIKEGKAKSKADNSTLLHNNLELVKLNSKLDKLLGEEWCPNSEEDKLSTLNKLKEAINMVENNNKVLQEELSNKLIFRSRVKWTEEGEKSTKYFLNLIKERQAKMKIRKIVANGRVHTTQDEISKAISNFYKNLYKKEEGLKDLTSSSEEMFENLPKLSEEDQKALDAPLSLNELKNALKTCGESAPGPDGITYKTYDHLWNTFGNLIYNAWTYSCQVKSLPTSQKDSVITLLEKKEKDKTKIENLRPISLSNCDIKICTKALAIRTNKILDKIMISTQTGYIPGRQVTDNSRLLEEIINNLKLNNTEAYLITLDAQKAFDSVDHKYLQDILEKYGFPPTYIDTIKMIYTDSKSISSYQWLQW
jgi:exonuclease III